MIRSIRLIGSVRACMKKPYPCVSYVSPVSLDQLRHSRRHFSNESDHDSLFDILDSAEDSSNKETKKDARDSEVDSGNSRNFDLDLTKISELLDNHVDSIGEAEGSQEQIQSEASKKDDNIEETSSSSYDDFNIIDNFLKEEFGEMKTKDSNVEANDQETDPTKTFEDFFNRLKEEEKINNHSSIEDELLKSHEEFELHKSQRGRLDSTLEEDQTSPPIIDDLFGQDFLDMGKIREVITKKKPQEKETLANLFRSLQTEDHTGRSGPSGSQSWSHKNSIRETREQFDRTLSSTRIGLSAIYMKELNKQVQEALKPTLDYINELKSVSDIVDYYDGLIQEWYKYEDKVKQDESLFETIYLHKLLKDSTLDEKHREFIDELIVKTQENPQSPKLNALTFSVIFNHILRVLAFKYHDGLTALSLYNLLKKDLQLYTIICNQETYNDVLRILWIYRGKTDLYPFEMTFLEMKHCGFDGDFKTFNILKQVLLDYYQLRFGKADGINGQNHSAIWSQEENRRSQALEGRLRQLYQRLIMDSSIVNSVL
ncbi:uncharacterized protein RJT21DRAFT_123369 [Scheffersomyces amazonensis]|uniref:uncharacterized protein n=1 Tax=Scheffersomyces amazonensis TaxID=1078765 RepID=UPI00315DAD1F